MSAPPIARIDWWPARVPSRPGLPGAARQVVLLRVVLHDLQG